MKTFLGMGDTEKMGSEWGKGKSALFFLRLRQRVCCFLFLSPEAKFGPIWSTELVLQNQVLNTSVL